MKTALAALAPLALLALLCLPGTGHAASLRCSTELVSDGASKAEVLMKCGEPLTKDSRTIAVSERVWKNGHSVEQTVYKTVDEWTYNFGSNRFMQIVVFENGALVEVRSGPYGR